MHFQIHKHRSPNAAPPLPNSAYYTWTLEKKEGAVCQSAEHYASIPEARSAIAAAKKTMAGVQRTKVVNPVER